MTILRIAIDLILRLSKEKSTDFDALMKQVRGLMEVGSSEWLSEDFDCGADAFDLLWREADESQRAILESVLCRLVDLWRTEESTRPGSKIGLAGLWYVATRLNPQSETLLQKMETHPTTALQELAFTQLSPSSDFPRDWPMAGYFDYCRIKANATEFRLDFSNLIEAAFSSTFSQVETFTLVGELLLGALEQNRSEVVKIHAEKWILLSSELPSRELENWAGNWESQIQNMAGRLPEQAMTQLIGSFYLAAADNLLKRNSTNSSIAEVGLRLDKLLGLGGRKDGTFSFVYEKVIGCLLSAAVPRKSAQVLLRLRTDMDYLEPMAASLLQLTRQAIENEGVELCEECHSDADAIMAKQLDFCVVQSNGW
jgi:hypothetical protein